MAEVTFPPEIGGDGTTISDDSNPATGLGNNGHRTRFIKALQQMVAVGQKVVATGQEVAAWAANVLQSPATNATSSTELTMADSGTIAFELDQPNKAFLPGMPITLAAQADLTQRMVVLLQTFDAPSGDATATISSATDTGDTFNAWNVFRGGDSGGAPITRAISVAGGLLTGGGTLAADFAISLAKATVAQISGGTVDNAAVTPKGLKDSLAPLDLTDQATIAWDMGQRETAKVVLGGNRALGKPTNYKRGETKYLEVWQDGTGGRTLSLHACYEPGDQPPVVVTPGAGKMTLVTVYCMDADPTNPRFRYGYSLDAS